MTYKNLFLTLLFSNLVYLTVYLQHDVYQLFIAVVSCMLAYAFVCFICRSKIYMLFLFIFISMAVCQGSATAKRAQMDQEFRQQLKQDPFGAFVGDLVHGYKRVVSTYRHEVKNSFVEAKNSDDQYTGFEEMNYRYLGMGVVGSPMLVCLVLRKKPKKDRKGKTP